MEKAMALPEDLYGLRLTTSPAAADLYNEALGRILRLDKDAHHPLLDAIALDPDFALGHAALAVLSHEFGTDDSTQGFLEAAVRLAPRSTRREQQFIEAYAHRVAGDYAFLLEYLEGHPRDVLGVSIAMPTIAFSGAYGIPDEAWAALDDMAAHFTEDWWYCGLLAFARQDQGRMGEALELATYSLEIEPRGGNAAHAAAHVYLETGRHADGLAWLDHWIGDAGQDSTHRCHYSWHAALYELSLDDVDAVARRYRRELAPGIVHGTRALVDTASLLFRCELESVEVPEADPAAVLAAAGDLGPGPISPFVGLHLGLGLALVDDEDGLRRLRRDCREGADGALGDTMATFVDGLLSYVRGEFSQAADLMLSIRHDLVPIGGSYAQRAVVVDTAIAALCRSGRGDEAARLLRARLDRRDRPRDLVLLDRAERSIRP
jgi:tetratricopeptide (TPR) repeat protein